MTRIKNGRRCRTRTPKVKTGCRTCKNRRVKCDEARPECKRCTAGNFVCQGYDVLVVRPASSSSSSSPELDILRVPSQSSPTELRALQFFQENTQYKLGVFFCDEFWSSKILCLAYWQLPIRNALVALSSSHEAFMRGESAGPGSMALMQYNQAIQETLAADSVSNNACMPLISCIIFTCVELLQGRPLSAVQLVKMGYRLCTDLRASSSQKGYSPSSSAWLTDENSLLDCAEEFISLMLCQVHMIFGNGDDTLGHVISDLLNSRQRDTPKEMNFTSLSEARTSLAYIYASMGVEQMATAKTQLASWLDAFAKYKALNEEYFKSTPGKRTAALLDMQVKLCEIELDANWGREVLCTGMNMSTNTATLTNWPQSQWEKTVLPLIQRQNPDLIFVPEPSLAYIPSQCVVAIQLFEDAPCRC